MITGELEIVIVLAGGVITNSESGVIDWVNLPCTVASAWVRFGEGVIAS